MTIFDILTSYILACLLVEEIIFDTLLYVDTFKKSLKGGRTEKLQ